MVLMVMGQMTGHVVSQMSATRPVPSRPDP